MSNQEKEREICDTARKLIEDELTVFRVCNPKYEQRFKTIELMAAGYYHGALEAKDEKYAMVLFENMLLACTDLMIKRAEREKNGK